MDCWTLLLPYPSSESRREVQIAFPEKHLYHQYREAVGNSAQVAALVMVYVQLLVVFVRPIYWRVVFPVLHLKAADSLVESKAVAAEVMLGYL